MNQNGERFTAEGFEVSDAILGDAFVFGRLAGQYAADNAAAE